MSRSCATSYYGTAAPPQRGGAPGEHGYAGPFQELMHVESHRIDEIQGMDEEIEAGCIVWKDENGATWCLDADGAYGTPGSISYLHDGHWCLHVGGKQDGCIYWEDEQGVMWCRDVEGAYGPAGEQYRSTDGETWFGDSEAWLELADEAAEFFAARADTLMKRQVAAQSGALARGKKDAKAWENDMRVVKIARGAGGHDACDAQQGTSALQEAEASRRVLYGDEMLARIAMEEARMNACFDVQIQSKKHVMWPELPLKMS
jgi:hypothetical protein